MLRHVVRPACGHLGTRCLRNQALCPQRTHPPIVRSIVALYDEHTHAGTQAARQMDEWTSRHPGRTACGHRGAQSLKRQAHCHLRIPSTHRLPPLLSWLRVADPRGLSLSLSPRRTRRSALSGRAPSAPERCIRWRGSTLEVWLGEATTSMDKRRRLPSLATC